MQVDLAGGLGEAVKGLLGRTIVPKGGLVNLTGGQAVTQRSRQEEKYGKILAVECPGTHTLDRGGKSSGNQDGTRMVKIKLRLVWKIIGLWCMRNSVMGNTSLGF